MEFSLPVPTPNRVDCKRMLVRRHCLSLTAGAVLAVGAAGCNTTDQARVDAGQNIPVEKALTLKDKGLALSAVPSGWVDHRNTFPKHPTWTFMPSSVMPNGKHALMIVLHGCNQTYHQLKQFGNLETVASKRGILLAIPDVGNQHYGDETQRCWNYDMAKDNNHHMDEVINIAETLAASNSGNNVDPNHIYVIGLSSGAGMALNVACKRPDLFAGVGAVAGPSVGSMQGMAFYGPLSLPSGLLPMPLPMWFDNVNNAVTTCKSLAATTGTSAQFETQIANIAVGDMDKDSPNHNDRYPFQSPINQYDCDHAGQVALVSYKWSPDNVQALRRIYAAGELGSVENVQGHLATKQAAMKNGKERISFVTIKDVGHAWPGSAPTATCTPTNDPNTQSAGVWIAKQGLDYPEFITDWLMTNNVRASNPITRAAVPIQPH
jgi:poly(3-hydroxybutyrate) depolymerase